MRRLLFVCLIALLAFPVVASAAFQAGDAPDLPVRHENAPAAEVSAPRITVSRESNDTLPTVLAAVSLGIALTGTTYVAFRLRSLPRT
jgi:hypothetical protein